MRASNFLRGVLAVIVLGAQVACERKLTTEPAASADDAGVPHLNVALPLIPVATPYPGAVVPGQIALCKDASSPAGTYFFSISATQTQSGDQVASGVTLNPSECAIIFNRVADGVGSLASLTITEFSPSNAQFRVDRIVVQEAGNLPGNGTFTGTPTVTVQASSYHGALVTYFNAPNTLPKSTPYPGTQNPGDVKVCKDASSPAGNYRFFFGFSNTAGGDKFPQSSLTLTPGQCAIVFQRFTAQATSASITITENVPFGSPFYVDHIIRTDQSGTISQAGPGNSITTTENFSTGSVVTFFNAPNVGLPTPTDNSLVAGQVKLCKDISSVPGNYQFRIGVANFVSASDQSASGAALSPGQCVIIFTRSSPQAAPATITVTEGAAGGAATVDRVVTTKATGSTTTTSIQVSAHTNSEGIVITYFNNGAPLPQLTAYPGTVTPGQVKICKAASSPAGLYTINFTGASGFYFGDRAGNPIVLAPGQCAIAFSRTITQPSPATLTYTESVGANSPFALDHIVSENESGSSTVPGPSVTATIDLNAGAVLTFFNVEKSVGLPRLTDASQVPGNVKVCVDHGSPAGNYFFFIGFNNILAGDQTASSVTLTSGQCGLVFVRTHAGPSPASIFISESIPNNATFTLHKIVRVDGAGTAILTGPNVNTLNNGGTGSVVTFFNIPR